MDVNQKRYRGEPRKKQRRRDETALTNVVSLRVSDHEKKMIEKITRSTSKNVSEVVREALMLWLAKRQQSGPDF